MSSLGVLTKGLDPPALGKRKAPDSVHLESEALLNKGIIPLVSGERSNFWFHGHLRRLRRRVESFGQNSKRRHLCIPWESGSDESSSASTYVSEALDERGFADCPRHQFLFNFVLSGWEREDSIRTSSGARWRTLQIKQAHRTIFSSNSNQPIVRAGRARGTKDR